MRPKPKSGSAMNGNYLLEIQTTLQLR